MNWENLLKDKKIKVTRARIDILKILQECQKSMTAEHIYSIFCEHNKDVNISTIYRSLELFEEKNIVDKVFLPEGVNGFSLKKDDHKHRLKCEICNKEILVHCPFKQIEELINSEANFKITDHSITLKGICEDCNDKNNKGKYN